MKPRINRDKLHNITVRAGQFVKFDTDVIGEPPPTISWALKEQVLEPSERIKIENEDYNTRIVISNTSRKDTGKYTVTAENVNGKDTAEVEVTILGEKNDIL